MTPSKPTARLVFAVGTTNHDNATSAAQAAFDQELKSIAIRHFGGDVLDANIPGLVEFFNKNRAALATLLAFDFTPEKVNLVRELPPAAPPSQFNNFPSAAPAAPLSPQVRPPMPAAPPFQVPAQPAPAPAPAKPSAFATPTANLTEDELKG